VTASFRPSGRVVLGVVVVALMLFGFAAMRLWSDSVIGTAEYLTNSLRGLGAVGVIGFALLQIVVAVSGVLPASLLGLAAGTIYGLAFGFALAAISTMVGALLTFLLSRSAFRPMVERMCARRPRLRDLDALIAADGWKLVCLLRISPVMPFAATSYVLGLSSIGMGAYLVGTLASLPALLGYVFIGTLADAGLSAWSSGSGPLRWVLLGAGGVATLALIIHAGRIATRLGVIGATRGTSVR
jgi:uncharacterized membrane protein YdjX (TVP38/TMEM64 family)